VSCPNRVTLLLALLLSSFALPCSAKAAVPAVASTSVEDPAFARYIDLVVLGKAWDNLDASLLADCALQLAEGERVLQRSHALITAAQVFELAAKTAAEQKDTKTLDRLTKACEVAKNTAALEQINLARKLAGTSRSATPAASVSALETSPKQLQIYQKALQGLRAADILGDVKYLDKLSSDLKSDKSSLSQLTKQQKDNLEKLAAQYRASLPQKDNQALAETLSKLKGTSRGFGCRFGSLFGGLQCFGDDDYEEEEYYEPQQYVEQQPAVPRQPTQPQPQPQQPALPQWLLGRWQLMDGRAGGVTYCEFTPDGKFITIDMMVTAQGQQESGRTGAAAKYTASGLQLGDKLFQVSSTTPGTLTLTLGSESVQIKRVEPAGGAQPGAQPPGPGPSGGGQPPANPTSPSVVKIRVGGGGTPQVAGQLPTALQGTWFEVTADRFGSQQLIRYELSADGTYDLLQYNVNAEGEVDLNTPAAQLSKIASPQQRSVAYANGQLTLGAGQRFAEGPFAASPGRDSAGQPTLGLGGGRVWSRSP
jgi:hypothetical protein